MFHAGDRITGAPYIVPGVGIAFNLAFPPGVNDIFVRDETSDPIIFTAALDSLAQASHGNAEINLLYGIFMDFY